MDKTVEDLMKAGLTSYEAKAYYVLLQKSSLTANEISKLANIPRTSTYQALNTLTQRGFCRSINGKVTKFQAISPKYAFRSLIQEYEQKINKKQEFVDGLAKSLGPLYEKQKNDSTPLDYIYVVKEKPVIEELLNRYEHLAKEEIIGMVKPPYVVDMDDVTRTGLSKKAESVKYIFLAEEDELNSEKTKEYFKLWEDIGAEVRVSPKLPVKLIIYDNKTVIMSIPDDFVHTESYTAMVIDHPKVAQFFKEIFQVYFDKSKKLS